MQKITPIIRGRARVYVPNYYTMSSFFSLQIVFQKLSKMSLFVGRLGGSVG